jgi:hypothetical protein
MKAVATLPTGRRRAVAAIGLLASQVPSVPTGGRCSAVRFDIVVAAQWSP